MKSLTGASWLFPPFSLPLPGAQEVVPKKSGAIRICVDLQLLNENVLWEIYPIPSVDETLVQ